jgi:hypothetical protein
MPGEYFTLAVLHPCSDNLRLQLQGMEDFHCSFLVAKDK